MPKEIISPPEGPAAEPKVEQEEKKGKPPVLLFIGLGILLLTIILFVVLLIIPQDWRVNLRDASIILLVFLMLVFSLLNLWLIASIIWGVDRLSKRLDLLLEQGSEVLDRVQGTASTIKGTADFVGERIASPFISLSARISGTAATIATLVRGQQDKGGTP